MPAELLNEFIDKNCTITLTIDKSSTITLVGDSYITSLNSEDTSNANINLNGYKLYINGVELK